jgi:hypothetical protein
LTAEGIMPAETSSGSRTSMIVTSPVGASEIDFSSLYGIVPLSAQEVSLLRRNAVEWKPEEATLGREAFRDGRTARHGRAYKPADGATESSL